MSTQSRPAQAKPTQAPYSAPAQSETAQSETARSKPTQAPYSAPARSAPAQARPAQSAPAQSACVGTAHASSVAVPPIPTRDGDGSVYRPDLPAQDLIDTIGALRKWQLVTERLLCRYLADLADRIADAPGSVRCHGFTDIFDAADHLLGLGVRAARERVRVGRALRQLPRIEQAFEGGAISFARVREITRVADPHNEGVWLELGRRLPTRKLERRVAEAGRRDKRAKRNNASREAADVDTLRVVLDLPVDDWTILQTALRTVRDAAPGILTDAEAIVALAHATLRQNGDAGGGAKPAETLLPDNDATGHDGPGHDSSFTAAGRTPDCPTDHDPAGSGRTDNRSPGRDPAGSYGTADRTSDSHAPGRDPAGAGRTDNRSPDQDPAGSYGTADRTSDSHAPDRDPAGSYRDTDRRPDNRSSAHDASEPKSSKMGHVLGVVRTEDAQRDATLSHAGTLLRYLSSRPRCSTDELCDATGLDVPTVSEALLELELQGSIYRAFWGYYAVRVA